MEQENVAYFILAGQSVAYQMYQTPEALAAFRDEFLRHNPQYTDVQFLNIARKSSTMLRESAEIRSELQNDPALAVNYWYDEGEGTTGPLMAEALQKIETWTRTRDVLGIIWDQGQSDTVHLQEGQVAADFLTGTDLVLRTLMEAAGTDRVYLQGFGDRSVYFESNDRGSDLLRELQQEFALQHDYAILANATYDLPLADSVHFTVEGFVTAATRLARAISTGEVSPCVGDVVFSGTGSIYVTVPDALAGLTMAENSTAFRLYGADGRPLAVQSITYDSELRVVVIVPVDPSLVAEVSYASIRFSSELQDAEVLRAGDLPVQPFNRRLTIDTDGFAHSGVAGGRVAVGTTGTETLDGTALADFLDDGGGGGDTLRGGTGDDRYAVTDRATTVAERMGEGTDTVVATGSYTLGRNVENLYLAGAGATGRGNELDNGIIGSLSDDVLDGFAGNDAIDGRLGNDRLEGHAGHDRLDGGDGDDLLFGGTDDDVLEGGRGRDNLRGDEGNDRIFGGVGQDSLAGGPGADELHGGSQGDTLDGGLGDDVIAGEDGHDTLFGEAGFDRLAGGDGDDEMAAGEDDDFLDGGAGDDLLDGGDGADILLGGRGFDHLIGGLGDDELRGGLDADILEGGEGNDRIYGESHYDELSGGAGDDLLFGGSDRDILHGDGGSDEIRGGTGNDFIVGGDDADLLVGDAGEDRIEGGLGDDALRGGDDADTLAGNDGSDDVRGQAGDDRLHGASGNDVLRGGAGVDVLSGGFDNDRLLGEGDNDRLEGDGGADFLSGGTGDDVLIGGRDRDRLLGGEGSDTFVFALGDTPGPAGSDQDVIRDFSHGDADRIDLSAFGGLTFVGAAEFSGVAGELRYRLDGNLTFVEGDLDGDGASDFLIQLIGQIDLTAADFVL